VPTALVGALLVVSADLVARRVFAPTELPVGVATAVVGAPYLLWLLTREIRVGAM
jgi:iron complex transport system permease protein